MKFPTRTLALVLVGSLVLVGVGATGAFAQDAGEQNDEVRIVDEEITIADGTITISDTTLNGPGLPDEHIEERRYTLEESTVQFDGFHVTFQGTEYTFCRITINVEEVGLLLEDVQLNDTS